MPEEPADTVRSDGTDNPAPYDREHDEAFAEAFAASLADPAPAEAPPAVADSSPSDAKPAIGGEIPLILLIQAGLTVFNAVIILIYLVFWMVDLTILANALRVGASFAFFLSIAPALLGAFLIRRYTKQKINPPGLIWAHAGVYVGVAMCTLTLLIPMIVTIRSLFDAQ
ncbi:MAG TPA: hypothetical protein VML01_10215 [Bryobacterales bacterium]|nr:hypothetical protein [Bryobacterales bacterium]